MGKNNELRDEKKNWMKDDGLLGREVKRRKYAA